MEVTHVDEAIELLEKANAGLEPELLAEPSARKLLESYVRAGRLAAFGVAALSRKLDDAAALARLTGTSIDKAKATVATGKALGSAPELSDALQHGDISLDQAAEIATAEESFPGAATELIVVAQGEAFHVLRDKARRIKLEAEQHRGLAERQRQARSSRSYSDELGMVHVHLPGSPMSARPSWPGPRPKPPAWRAPLAETAAGETVATTTVVTVTRAQSPSSATSPTPMPLCYRGRAKEEPSVPSWSCW